VISEGLNADVRRLVPASFFTASALPPLSTTNALTMSTAATTR
jgi:hypothetical protein